jgi:hypothetical protein
MESDDPAGLFGPITRQKGDLVAGTKVALSW